MSSVRSLPGSGGPRRLHSSTHKARPFPHAFSNRPWSACPIHLEKGSITFNPFIIVKSDTFLVMRLQSRTKAEAPIIASGTFIFVFTGVRLSLLALLRITTFSFFGTDFTDYAVFLTGTSEFSIFLSVHQGAG